MNESLPESEESLALKKRARRRLIGAIVFATLAAVVLPMVMDKDPPPATPNIELAIPAQDKGFIPPATGAPRPAVGVAEPVPAALPDKAAPALAEVAAEAVRPAEPKAVPARAVETKPVAKAAKAEPAKPAGDARRVQSILDGKAEGAVAAGPHVVLIGAFANAGNVQILQKKLSEMGIRVYTEQVDSPQGRKTRVRAGPFPTREAAEKAATRMKSIGVGGVVAPKA